jgi:hypothetical protein
MAFMEVRVALTLVASRSRVERIDQIKKIPDALSSIAHPQQFLPLPKVAFESQTLGDLET